MRSQSLLVVLILVTLAGGCSSRYGDGWQPQPEPADASPEIAPKAEPERRPAQPAPTPTEAKPSDVAAPQDSLAALNDQFRVAYKVAREEMLLGAAPYAIVLGDCVVFNRGSIRREVPYTNAMYHELKAIAHVPLAVFALLRGAQKLSEEKFKALSAYRDAAKTAKDSLERRGYDEKTLKRQQAILSTSLNLMDRALDMHMVDAGDLAVFCTTAAPLLLLNAYDAGKLQLEGLNAAFTDWMRALSEEERKTYHIVVSGSHQARDRNLQMTYCRALLGETGSIEVRLIFGESVFDEKGCRNLLSTHLLDEAASKTFFDDGLRLQYDLLGDVAAEMVPRLAKPR